MLPRRLWLLTVLVTAFAWLPSHRLAAQQGNSINSAEYLSSQNITPLADQLTKGLRAITPEQKQFVLVIVAYVEQGKIPRAMVNLVYRWALERNDTVPFPYFEYAMRTLSRRRGVVLP